MGLDVLWSVSESKARGFGPSCGMVGVQQSLSYSSLWNVLGSSWDRTGCRFVVFGVRESFLSLSGVIWLVLCVTWICIGPSMCDIIWSWRDVWASKVPVFSLECLGLERSWLALPWRVWTETYSFNPFSLEFLAVCVCPFSGTEKACHWFCLIEVPNFWCHTICHSLSLECLWSGFHLECLSVTVFGSYGLPFPWSVWGQKASNRSGHWSVPLVLFQCLRSDSTWLVLLLEF